MMYNNIPTMHLKMLYQNSILYLVYYECKISSRYYQMISKEITWNGSGYKTKKLSQRTKYQSKYIKKKIVPENQVPKKKRGKTRPITSS